MQFRRELIAVSAELGVEVLAYSPLAFGVLGCAPGSEERRPVTLVETTPVPPPASGKS